MKPVLIVFGSESDEPVFSSIIKNLHEHGVPCRYHVCSAHRTPDELETLLKKEWSMVIAGAGLAAHLPGVVAAKVLCPVIGVPCVNNYDGLDSVLSIVQMPPGIGVIGTAPNGAADFSLLTKAYQHVQLITDDEGEKSVEKAKEIFKLFEIPVTMGQFHPEAINLHFFSLHSSVPLLKNVGLVINIPYGKSTANDALTLLAKMKSGFWMGLGRGENAALCTIQLLNRTGSYTQALVKFRKAQKDKVLAADKSIQVKTYD